MGWFLESWRKLEIDLNAAGSSLSPPWGGWKLTSGPDAVSRSFCSGSFPVRNGASKVGFSAIHMRIYCCRSE